MNNYSLSHLADHVVLRDLAALASQDRATTAALLAHLAEVDDRKLYLPAAHASMFVYCVRELRMSEDTAFRRIGVARTARLFPAIFPALADGRLNMTSVLLLQPHLTPRLGPDRANALLAAAAHKSKAEIELLLAEHFPKPDMPTAVQAVAPNAAGDISGMRQTKATFIQLALERAVPSSEQNALIRMGPLAACADTRAQLAPLSPGRFSLQLTVNQATHDLLRYAQSLLGHTVPSGEVSQVIERALVELVKKLEQKKFAKCARSRPGRGTANGRHVPADVRRAVWERDGGQCTFVSDRGHRCEARTRLEFDHVHEVARGGQTSVDGMRLRCRAHNQFTAECTFGPGFMREKREEARCKAARAKETAVQRAQEKANQKAEAQAMVRERAQEKAKQKAEAHAMAQEKARKKAQEEAQERARERSRSEATAEATKLQDVTPWLRRLGFTIEEARKGAARCADIPDAPLEQRVRVALQGLAPNCVRLPAFTASAPA